MVVNIGVSVVIQLTKVFILSFQYIPSKVLRCTVPSNCLKDMISFFVYVCRTFLTIDLTHTKSRTESFTKFFSRVNHLIY